MLHTALTRLAKNQVLFAALLIALAWLVLEIRGILISLFVSYIIMAALNPYVKKLVKWKLPKSLAAALVYLTTLTILGLTIIPLIPFFTTQVTNLFTQLPNYIDTTTKLLGLNINVSQFEEIIANEFETIGRNAVSLSQQVFGGLFSILSVLVISFYLLLDHDRFKRSLLHFFPSQKHELVNKKVQKIEHTLGSWLRGQIILSFTIGLTTYIILLLLGLPFALPLALIAGILEIVPTIGPIIAAIPAVIIAFNINPTLALFVIIAYLGIQILENNLLVPKIMEKAVGLNPVIILIGVIVGGKLLGIAGALLSIPFISLLKVALSKDTE